MKHLWHFLIYVVAIYGTARLLPGIKMKSIVTAIIVAVCIGVAGVTITPILKFFAFPITVLTLGLFTFVIDAIIIVIVDKILEDFEVDGFGWAFIYAVVLAIINSILQSIF